MLLLVASFVCIHWLKYGHLAVSDRDMRILVALLGTWAGISVFMRLPSQMVNAPLLPGLALLAKSSLILLFLLSLLVNALQLMHWSRLMVYGSSLLFAALAGGGFTLYRFLVPGRDDALEAESHDPGYRPMPQLFILDAILLAGSFFVLTMYKRSELALSEPYDDVLAITFGLWLLTALITRKFNRNNFINFYEAISPAVKSILLLAGVLAFLIFGLRLGPVSRLQVFGSLGLFFVLEGGAFYLLVAYRKYSRGPEDIEDVGQARDFVRTVQKDLPAPPQKEVTDPVQEKIQHALEFFYPQVFPFLDHNIDLQKIDRSQAAMFNTDDMFNLDTLDQESMRLIVNLHKLNDIRWFNRYFLLAHTRLQPGGYLVGMSHTIATHRSYYASRFPRPLDSIMYAVSFAWRRAFPKLPWLQKVYFGLTKGRNRMVSRAEILGRLYFCGFKAVAEQEIGHRLFFIARKVKTPAEDENPTFGPLVRLKRYGQGGKPMLVYKFRTMFPYSEYLQEYVYENHSLDQGGKFKDDFRVTGWGAFMRRTWLDELPMIWNWVKGDMQLIGVRPLSSQYLSLYSPEVRELRAQVKPGLLPPFYAHMPETLDEIMASEAAYLREFLDKPLRTQWKYFWLCFWNIVVKKRRSK
jgi:hypothetical protein